MRIPRIFGSACIGALLAGLAVPAFAQDEITINGHRLPGDEVTRSMHVNYSDLDTSTAAGRRALNYRLYDAADYVCGRGLNVSTDYDVFDQCREEAYRDALTRVGTYQERMAPRRSYWIHQY